jgi:hypothetical protein
MPVQTTYDLEHQDGFAGQMGDLQLTNVLSATVTGSTIDHGLAVVRGANDGECILATATGGSFLGVTVRTTAGVADVNGVNLYDIGESANILDEGIIYAICESGCTQGDAVYFRFLANGANTVLGALGNTVDQNAVPADTADLIPNAVWDTTTAAGKIGRIKFK